MIGKKTSVKKMFFWLTAGMVLSMTAIILVSFFSDQKYRSVMGWAGINSLRCTMDAFYGTTVGNETVKFYF